MDGGEAAERSSAIQSRYIGRGLRYVEDAKLGLQKLKKGPKVLKIMDH